MKFTKRMLAVTLTLALALSLALPAAAAVDWNDFRITKQPQNLTIKYGESFMLSVEVNVPAGVEVEYQWYTGSSSKITGATTSEMHLGPNDHFYPENYRYGGASTDFICEITAYEKDGGGNVVSTRFRRSDMVYVSTKRTSLGKLIDVTIGPFGYAFTAVVVSPAFIFIFPLAYLGFLIYFYGKGFVGLFS